MPVAGDIARVDVFYDFAGQRYQNGFHFQNLVGGSSFAALASAFKTAFVKNTSGGILALMADDVTSTHLEVVDVKPGSGATYELSYGAVAGSDAATDPLPPQTALVIKWGSALAGRSFRGRSYFSVLTEGAQASGTWVAGPLTLAAAFVTSMLAIYGPTGTDPDWIFGVVSRQHNGLPVSPPHFQPITAGVVRSTVFTQRRRTIGVGR